MVVTCEICQHTYDDVYHWTSCPHDYFPMQTLAMRSDGTTQICTTLEELDRFLHDDLQ